MRNLIPALLMALSTPLLPAAEPHATTTPAHTPVWLENAVFYQIYPQSYRDSNGDGIGDLRGIIEKLPYLHDLGVTAIWLSPCYESPFGDAGYDVADFYKVAPRYGTNDDLRALFAEAHKIGIRVMLDLVAGHTSNQNEWFRQSQRHERNPYTDWYIWNDDIWNWFTPGLQLVVGGSERAANYVPNFFHFQPALNYGFAQPDPKAPWQQPITAPGPQAVRAELKKIMAFWFDLGASGFRVDMAGSLVKNDPDGKATAALWAEFRAWMNTEYPDRAMVSEWAQPQIAIPNGFHMDFLLPFSKPGYKALFRPDGAAAPIFDRSGTNSIRTFLDEFEPLYTATRGQGFIAIPSGNHDTVPRLGNGRDARDLSVAMAFLLTMPGVPFLYYGDEIGMRSLDGLPSKEGGYGRTGCRTPMQWTGFANAGFSDAPAAQLYLPIDPAADRPNIATEFSTPGSILRTTQQLIALRKAHPALGASGDFQSLVAERDRWPFVFRRAKDSEVILVALNPTDRPVTATFTSASPESVGRGFSPPRSEQSTPALCRLASPEHPEGSPPITHLLGEPGAFIHKANTWTVQLPPLSYAIVRVAE